MAYFGVSVLCCAVMIFFFSENEKRSKRLLYEREFLTLFIYVKRELSCYLSPISDIVRRFESKIFSEAGLVDRLNDGASVYDAVLSTAEKLGLSGEARKIILEYFSFSGREYLDAESSRITLCTERYSEYVNIRECECERTNKLFRVLAFATCFGIIIFVI